MERKKIIAALNAIAGPWLNEELWVGKARFEEAESADEYYGRFALKFDKAAIVEHSGLSLVQADKIASVSEYSEECSLILKETNSDTYWKVPGWFSSYANGAYYEINNTHQVKPVEVTIIQWKDCNA